MNSILIISNSPNLLPERKTIWSACLDLCVSQDIEIEPWKIKVISAWIKTFMPQGRHSKVYIRSWSPTKQGIVLANSVAIFDADYRWEYLLQLRNISSEKVQIDCWTRVAQLEFCPTYMPETKTYGTTDVPYLEILIDPYQYEKRDELYPTTRWTWALHSTGK